MLAGEIEAQSLVVAAGENQSARELAKSRRAGPIYASGMQHVQITHRRDHFVPEALIDAPCVFKCVSHGILVFKFQHETNEPGAEIEVGEQYLRIGETSDRGAGR